MNAESVQPAAVSEGQTPESRWPNEIQKWDVVVISVATQYVVDPDLLRAIIYFESYGRERVVSKSGACGLMQIMSSDTSSVMPWLFRNRPTCDELIRDPYFNVLYGTHYLVTLYNTVANKDWREALKRYGPMDVGYTYADRVIALQEEK